MRSQILQNNPLYLKIKAENRKQVDARRNIHVLVKYMWVLKKYPSLFSEDYRNTLTLNSPISAD